MKKTSALEAGSTNIAKTMVMVSASRCGLVADVCKRRLSLVGHCKFCYMDFCSAHRLPEQHACVGIAGCRQQARDRLAKQTPGAVVAAKVTSIGTLE